MAANKALAVVSSITPYDRTDKSLHWSMAVLFLLQFLSVWQSHGQPEAQGYSDVLLKIHAIGGFVILGLGCWRLVRWCKRRGRLGNDHHTAFARLIAGANHAGLYLMMIFQPATGLLSSLPINQAKFFQKFHAVGGMAILLLIGLHAGAALWHHFIARDETLRRMLPTFRD